MIIANDILLLAAFLRAHIGHFITGGFTLFGTGAIVWDNHKGRNHAINHLGARIDNLDLKVDTIKSELSRPKGGSHAQE